MALLEGADLRQRLALAPGHRRQVGLDVGELVAVTLAEAPAAGRHAAGDLDHLADAAPDQLVEEGVDDAVPRQQQAVEAGAAEQPADRVRQGKRVVEEASLPGGELGMGEAAPDPGLTRVVGGRRDRECSLHLPKRGRSARESLGRRPGLRAS